MIDTRVVATSAEVAEEESSGFVHDSILASSPQATELFQPIINAFPIKMLLQEKVLVSAMNSSSLPMAQFQIEQLNNASN